MGYKDVGLLLSFFNVYHQMAIAHSQSMLTDEGRMTSLGGSQWSFLAHVPIAETPRLRNKRRLKVHLY